MLFPGMCIIIWELYYVHNFESRFFSFQSIKLWIHVMLFYISKYISKYTLGHRAIRGFPEMGLEPNLKRSLSRLSRLSRQGLGGVVVRYYRHQGQWEQRHRRASLCLQVAVKGAEKVKRGGRKVAMKSLVNHVKGSRQLPIEDTRRGLGRPCLLWRAGSRTTFATGSAQ